MTIMIDGKKMVEVVKSAKRICVLCLEDWAELGELFCTMCGFEKRLDPHSKHKKVK